MPANLENSAVATELEKLSCFSRVRLCVTPQTAAHQAPPSLGFSRQEHWSGLPFPSPMQESEKVKVKSLRHVRLFETPWTAAYQAPPSMGVSRQEYWNGVPLPSPNWKRSVLIPIPKKGNAKECSNYCTIALISDASKVILKILQVRLQQYMTLELPDVQDGFQRGRGNRDQITSICWIMEKAREFQKSIYFCFTDLG